jgi:hypothetical protein
MRLLRRPKAAPAVEAEAAEVVEPVEGRRVLLRRPGLPFIVNWTAILVILALIIVTVFSLLLIQGLLPAQVVTWWPLSVAVLAALWFLVSLVRRQSRGLLASTALFGLSVSMLLAAQGVASLQATFVGVTFIAIGTGIVLRGLLLRHQPIGY